MVKCTFCHNSIKIGKKFCSLSCYYSYLKTKKGDKNSFFGKKHQKHTLTTLSEKAKLRKHSEETKKKIGLAQKGISKGPMHEKTKNRLSQKIKQGFLEGRIVWNKGLTKKNNKSIKTTSEKLSIIAKQRISIKNPMFGKKRSEKQKQQQSKYMKNRFIGEKNAFFGKKHTEKTKNKLSNLAKLRLKRPGVIARLREQGVKSLLFGKKHSTKIELLVKGELEKRDIDFVFQYKFRNYKGQYVCVSDFAFPNEKIIVEVHGDFHHANPKIYSKEKLKPIQIKTIENDMRKTQLYEKEGWKLIILWGKDINDNVSSCVDKIEKVIKIHHNKL